MIEVTFSAVPVNERFRHNGTWYTRVNKLGLSGMMCNAQVDGKTKQVCFPLSEMVEVEDGSKAKPPAFRKGDSLECVGAKPPEADIDKGRVYVAADNSYFHPRTDKEWVQVERKYWELNLPVLAVSFRLKEDDDDSKTSSGSAERSEDSGLASDTGRSPTLGLSGFVESGSELDDAIEGLRRESGQEAALGSSTGEGDH